MYECLFWNFQNRKLKDAMEAINNFCEKTSFEIKSISFAYNPEGCLEVLVLMNDPDIDKDELKSFNSLEG